MEKDATHQRLLRKRKRSKIDEELPPPLQGKCDLDNCDMPICSLQATRNCPLNRYTPKWLHLSYGEHCCQTCSAYFIRPDREGNLAYSRWGENWNRCRATGSPTIRQFIADTILCYWLRCSHCSKWRQIPGSMMDKLTPDLVVSFTCSFSLFWLDNPCSSREDPRVAAVSENYWISGLLQPSLLEAPAFLAAQVQGYPPDCCGLVPRCWTPEELADPLNYHPAVYRDVLRPFQPPKQQDNPQPIFPVHHNGGWIKPDAMDPEEQEEFEDYKNESKMYLGIRNLIVALWNRSPKKWLTIAEVERHVICRGMARIRCLQEAESILRFLTVRSVINTGLVRPDCGLNQEETVVVVGSGIAGLAAACYLFNLGFNVTVLESRNRIGGRISDDINNFGVPVGKGCQEITGGFNNPLTLLALQGGATVVPVEGHDIFFLDKITKEEAEVVFIHLDMLLETLYEDVEETDLPLSEKLHQLHNITLAEYTNFTKEQLSVYNLALSLIEAGLGSDLKDVSTLYWKERLLHPQYGGPTLRCTAPGLSVLLAKMAAGLDIRLNSPVAKIFYKGDEVRVHTPTTVFKASRVLVTVPASCVSSIKFHPDLPPFKKKALEAVGIGHCEKIILKFDQKFWNGDSPAFATLPDFNTRNHLSYFKDLTYKKETGPFVLEIPVSGQALQWLKKFTDLQVVKSCMDQLRSLFSEVPSPLGWCVTRWYKQPGSCMTRSFLRPGTSLSILDDLAESLDSRVFFAGEATYRPNPGTAHGAYLSGLRAARQIYDSFSNLGDVEQI